MNIFTYYINCDERGEFAADVRDADDNTVFETDHEIFEDGYMRHSQDLDGLYSYLLDLGILTANDGLLAGN